MELSEISQLEDRPDDKYENAGQTTFPPNQARLRSRYICTTWTQRLRYFLIRLTSCPVPYLSAKIPVIGGRSAVEVGLMIVISIMVLHKSCENFKKAGKVLDIMLAIMIVLGIRTNLLTIMFGVSFDRAIYVHKMFGLLTMAVTIIHTLHKLNDTGIVLLTFMCVMVASYLVKPFYFELFYYSHIISFMIIAPVSVIHDHKSRYCGYMSIAWGIDMLIRYFIRGKKISNVNVKCLPGDIVRIEFDKCFDYNAGQYCFLRIRDIDCIQYHPISISSSPSESTMSFHIRALGDWSKKLLAKSSSDPDWKPELFVEGPYGNCTVDLDSDLYKVILFISGGIGITPCQSMYNQIVLDHEDGVGRDLRKVIFVWAVRDKSIISSMNVNPIHNNIESDVSASSVTNSKYLHRTFDESAHDDIRLLPEAFQPKHILSSDVKASERYDCSTLDGLNSRFLFHPAFYVTDGSSLADGIGDDTDEAINYSHLLQLGRPNMKFIFQQIEDLCRENDLSRVAVITCGPESMTNEVIDLCRQSRITIDSREDRVKFDCHIDIFDF